MCYAVGFIGEIYDNHFKWWWLLFNRLNEFIYFIYGFRFLVCKRICIKIPFSHTEYFPINQTSNHLVSEFDFALRLFFYYAIKPQDYYFIKWLMKCWHFLRQNRLKWTKTDRESGTKDLNRILFFNLFTEMKIN